MVFAKATTLRKCGIIHTIEPILSDLFNGGIGQPRTKALKFAALQKLSTQQ